MKPILFRNIGKTTTLVKNAIDYLLDGRSVTFVSFNYHSLMYAFKRFQDLSKNSSIDKDKIVFIAASIFRSQNPLTPVLHTNVVIFDDLHLMNPLVVNEMKSIAVPEGPFAALIETIHTVRINEPYFKKINKVCECGAGSVQSSIHSTWCPLCAP